MVGVPLTPALLPSVKSVTTFLSSFLPSKQIEIGLYPCEISGDCCEFIGCIHRCVDSSGWFWYR